MATRKSTTTVKKSPRTAAAKTTAQRKTTTTKKVTTPATTRAAVASKPSVLDSLPSNLLGIIGAEVVGTFILTMVVLLSTQYVAPLFVGLTVVALFIGLGVISGAHVNPAVTFGLWAARKLRTIMVPFYWAAQLLGAVLAVLVLNLLSGSSFGLSFSHFAQLDWGILSVELIGTAVFLFGLVATISRTTLSQTSRAFGVGLSLFVGIVVASTAYTYLQRSADLSNVSISDPSSIPVEYSVAGATLNPAVAVAVTENTVSELQGGSPAEGETEYSRFGLEVIIGTLVGAALGGNLYLLIARGSKQD